MITRAVGAREATRQWTCKATDQKPQQQGVWYDGLQSPKQFDTEGNMMADEGCLHRKPSASQAVLTTRYVTLHGGGGRGLGRGPGAQSKSSGAAWWFLPMMGALRDAIVQFGRRSSVTSVMARATNRPGIAASLDQPHILPSSNGAWLHGAITDILSRETK